MNRQYCCVKRGCFHAIHVKRKHAQMDLTEDMKWYFMNVLEFQSFARWVSRTTVQRAVLKNAVRDIKKDKKTEKHTQTNLPIDQPSKPQTILVLRGCDPSGQQQVWRPLTRADLSNMRRVLIWYSQSNQIWRLPWPNRSRTLWDENDNQKQSHKQIGKYRKSKLSEIICSLPFIHSFFCSLSLPFVTSFLFGDIPAGDRKIYTVLHPLFSL